MDLTVRLPKPHAQQVRFLRSSASRLVIRAGRRSGKTVGVAILAVEQFLAGRRILYGTPTQEQVDRFWEQVKRALEEPIEAGIFYKNETRHIIERAGTEQRIRAKTAWDADTLRGDYADLLILDEFQLMNEDAWALVGAPMLLDNNGSAVFIYTPPSLHSIKRTKARDPRHAAKLFKAAAADESGRWQTFHFTSHDNPHISREALDDLASDMTSTAYKMEILAEDIEDAPGALWKRSLIDATRLIQFRALNRIVVSIDPQGSKVSGETGIIVAGVGMWQNAPHLFVLEDASLSGSPEEWGTAAVTAYHKWRADRIVAERNFGGDMVESTIRVIDPSVSYKDVTASRGKQLRAEPVAALYEQGRAHHVGTFPLLEDEQVQWEPGMDSPNRLDALVWAATELMLGEQSSRARTRRAA